MPRLTPARKGRHKEALSDKGTSSYLLQGQGKEQAHGERVRAWTARDILSLWEKPVQQRPEGLQLSWGLGAGGKVFICARKQLCMLPVLVT